MDSPIPVTVITGFLGAGKSTLLERFVGELPRDTTAVIINEQGEVGIDAALLGQRTTQRAARIREITGGCVCCQTQAALDDALAEFAASTPTPTRILVETSGAASPAGVIRPVTGGRAREQLRLDGIITVIDAARARHNLQHALTIEQLGFADVVVMSHVDQCGEAELDALEQALGVYAPAAVFARAEHGRLPEQSLLGLLETRGEVLGGMPSPSEPGVARHGIDAVSLVHDGELDEQRFGEWVEDTLGTIEARLMRIKGILAVRGVDERVIVQGVGQAVEVTLGTAWGPAPRSSRLVVVGLGLGLDEATLQAGFAACAVGAGPTESATS